MLLPMFLNVAITLVGLFLILLVLIRRSIVGDGESSPIGSRDQFIRLTVYVAVIWLGLIWLRFAA